jgi:hypothetical protein
MILYPAEEKIIYPIVEHQTPPFQCPVCGSGGITDSTQMSMYVDWLLENDYPINAEGVRESLDRMDRGDYERFDPLLHPAPG